MCGWREGAGEVGTERVLQHYLTVHEQTELSRVSCCFICTLLAQALPSEFILEKEKSLT